MKAETRSGPSTPACWLPLPRACGQMAPMDSTSTPCAAPAKSTVAVATDFCDVHVFQRRCAGAKAPTLVYGHHGSHVTGVRSTHDNSSRLRLNSASLGGKKARIFQWRVLVLGVRPPLQKPTPVPHLVSRPLTAADACQREPTSPAA